MDLTENLEMGRLSWVTQVSLMYSPGSLEEEGRRVKMRENVTTGARKSESERFEGAML